MIIVINNQIKNYLNFNKYLNSVFNIIISLILIFKIIILFKLLAFKIVTANDYKDTNNNNNPKLILFLSIKNKKK